MATVAINGLNCEVHNYKGDNIHTMLGNIRPWEDPYYYNMIVNTYMVKGWTIK